MANIMSGVGLVTREYREVLRFSREELASRANVDADLIMAIEEDSIEDVDLTTLGAISASLKLPLHIFFSLAERWADKMRGAEAGR